MKKLTLNLDAIDVIPFATTARPAEPRGTVAAAEVTAPGQPSCGVTCQTSCAGGGHCTCYPG